MPQQSILRHPILLSNCSLLSLLLTLDLLLKYLSIPDALSDEEEAEDDDDDDDEDEQEEEEEEMEEGAIAVAVAVAVVAVDDEFVFVTPPD